MPLIAYGALAAFQMMAGNQQADAIRRQAAFKQQIDNMNAGYADLDAYNAEKQGHTQSARYQNVIDSTVAEQRTGYASSNVDVNYGTAAQVQGESRLTGLMNALDIQRQAREKAFGYTVQGINYRLGGVTAVGQGAVDAYGAEQAGVLNAARTGVSAWESNTVQGRNNLRPTEGQRLPKSVSDNSGGSGYIRNSQYGFVARDGMGEQSTDWYKNASNDWA